MRIGPQRFRLGIWRELLLQRVPSRSICSRLEERFIDEYVRAEHDTRDRDVIAALRSEHPELFTDPAAAAERIADLRCDLVARPGFTKFLRHRLLGLGFPQDDVERAAAPFEALARRDRRRRM